MKFFSLRLFSVPFFLLPSLLRADEVSIFSILALRGEETVWLERELPDADGENGFDLMAAIEGQLADLHQEERAFSLESLFPAGTVLKGIAVEEGDGTGVIHLTSLPSWGDQTAVLETISYLLGQWCDRLGDIERITLQLNQSDGEEWLSIESAARGRASKPKPEPETVALTGSDELLQPMSMPQAPGQGTAQPTGALSDASIFLNPGHGWHYVSSLGRWATQRGNLHQYIEDLGTAEAVLQYLHQYLWNAGARIYTARERDLNTNMVIVENGGAGYQETGSWITETVGGAYGGNHRRAFTVTGEPTATARFTPNIPEAGHYAVYVWYRPSSAGTTAVDTRISINHTGDSTQWVQNQNRDGYTWKYVGTHYFEEGSNPATGSVVIDNQSSTSGHRVIANAVRFGGGMGDLADNVSGTTSGKPRWEESGRYYAGFMGKSDWASSNSVNGMPRWAAWEHESWEMGKAVYVSWHTNAGGGTGTETFSHTTPVAGSPQLRNFIHDQVVRDIRAAWNPSWVDRGRKTASFGELSSANNPNMPAALLEVAFHDHAQDTKYLLDPEFRRQVARAVYKGLVQFYASSSMPGFTNSTYLPEPPRDFGVSANADGSVTLAWNAPLFSTGTTGLYGHAATGYRIYQSSNGMGFDNGIDVAGTSSTLTGFQPGDVVYLRASATNGGGESFPTATLAVRIPEEQEKKVLIVNGFDRNDRFMNVIENDPHSPNPLSRGYVDRLNTFNYIIPHAKAIQAYPELVGFDSAEASSVGSGAVSLLDYDAVIWMAGLQAHVNDIGTRQTPAFSSAIRGRLGQYRNAGGQIFISGAEVAWDSNRENQNSWLEAILKATFVERSASTNSAVGRSASIMAGWNGQFDDGSGPAYRVEFPDVIAPGSGAISAMRYTGTADQLVDGFDGIGGWKQPGFSGQTNADSSSSFTIVSTPVYHGSGSGRLSYVWGSGNFIRLFNEAQPQLPADSDLSLWVHGDGSNHRLRLAVRDSDGEIFVNNYTSINFTGWRELVWADVRNNANFWAVGGGDGVITGPNVSLDSIQVSRTVGSPSSGSIYFDYAVATPVDGGNENVQTAAIQFDGDHKVVYLAFPFESITSEVKQADLMTRTLDFFGFSQTPFEVWQRLYFSELELGNPEISGDLADPSGDGIPNIIAYALNLDPRVSNRDGLPEMSIESNFLTLQFNQAKNATDISYDVQVSDDLVSWKSGDGEVEIISTVDEGETFRVTVRDRTAYPESERRFIRLQVTR